MQSAEMTHDQGQLPKQRSTEILKVIQNYKIIVEHATNIDDGCKREKTARLLDAIFERYIPELEKSISGSDDDIDPDDIKDIQTEIKKLKDLRLKGGVRPGQEPQGQESHESPLVLLLSLAIELGEISVRDPREKNKRSEGQNAGGHDWGRLSGFLDYLKLFNFESHTSVGKTASNYRPGLPYCIMALVPFEDSHQKELKISVSASADRFDYDSTENLYSLILDQRKKRLDRLESSCNAVGISRISAARNYSKIMVEWNEGKERRRAELKERWDTDNEQLTQARQEAARAWLDAQKERGGKLEREKDASNKSWKDKRAVFDRQMREVDEEEIPDALDASVPVHLPVIISTWLVDGTYLPTCFLDCRRFRFVRPLGAEKSESSYGTKKDGHVYPATACAEWDGFVKWMGHCYPGDKTAKPPQTPVAEIHP